MRVHTLKCISFDLMEKDPKNPVITTDVVIQTQECTTVSEMVDNFNALLACMGFVARVDVADTEE